MKIAVIGSGISGMTAAYLLSEDHEVVLFEANDYIGGHTNTADVTLNGHQYPVDTGFIVFNAKTYIHFVKLMKRLGIGWQDSVMSFSVQCEKTGLEFSPSTLNSLFIQRRNLFRPAFYRMLWDVARFKRDAEVLLMTGDYDLTLSDYLTQKGYSKGFVQHFIIPMGEAIWSADPAAFNRFPVRYFAEFFKNHGFLNVKDQPQWLTIKGGSRQYIKPLTQPYRDRIRVSCPVAAVRRRAECVEVQPANAPTEKFDNVVIATHSDQALKLLEDPSDAERKILGAIPYQELCKCAANCQTDAIVIGSHTKENQGKWYAGSTVEKIGLRTASPVFVLTHSSALPRWGKGRIPKTASATDHQIHVFEKKQAEMT